MTNLNDLIERLEKATGPDRALSNEIAIAVGWNKAESMFNNWFDPSGRHQPWGSPPPYRIHRRRDDAGSGG